MKTRSRRAKQPVTVERIADAAIALVDDEGFQSLSMRKVGSSLGVEAMSLYHHVPSKVALLDAMVDQLARGLPALDLEHGWRACLSSASAAWLQLARQHPGAFPLIATRAQARPALMDWYLGVFEALRGAGVGPLGSARIASSFFVSLNGFLLAAGRPLLFSEVPEPSVDSLAGLSSRAMEALSAVPPEAWDLSTDGAFAAHVELQLGGIAAAIAKGALDGSLPAS